MSRRRPAGTEQDSLGWVLACAPWSARCRQQSRLEGRAGKRKMREGQGRERLFRQGQRGDLRLHLEVLVEAQDGVSESRGQQLVKRQR